MILCHEKVKCPNIVSAYNKHMGGVDLTDSLISRYRNKLWFKKWYHCLFGPVLVRFLFTGKFNSSPLFKSPNHCGAVGHVTWSVYHYVCYGVMIAILCGLCCFNCCGWYSGTTAGNKPELHSICIYTGLQSNPASLASRVGYSWIHNTTRSTAIRSHWYGHFGYFWDANKLVPCSRMFVSSFDGIGKCQIRSRYDTYRSPVTQPTFSQISFTYFDIIYTLWQQMWKSTRQNVFCNVAVLHFEGLNSMLWRL